MNSEYYLEIKKNNISKTITYSDYITIHTLNVKVNFAELKVQELDVQVLPQKTKKQNSTINMLLYYFLRNKKGD